MMRFSQIASMERRVHWRPLVEKCLASSFLCSIACSTSEPCQGENTNSTISNWKTSYLFSVFAPSWFCEEQEYNGSKYHRGLAQRMCMMMFGWSLMMSVQCWNRAWPVDPFDSNYHAFALWKRCQHSSNKKYGSKQLSSSNQTKWWWCWYRSKMARSNGREKTTPKMAFHPSTNSSKSSRISLPYACFGRLAALSRQ